jgi:DNA repair photolyase
MALNKVKPNGNMYQFLTHTWNPIGGKCPHKCSYCSTNKLMRYPEIEKKYSGEPFIVEKELLTNLGKGNFIFVCGQNDLFADDIPEEWINRILDYCKKFDNQYLFQTKNPQRYIGLVLPKNSVICTTIETNRYDSEIMGDSPSTFERASAMNYFRNSDIQKYVTIEPIMDFDLKEMVELIKKCNPTQVNLGGDSGGNNLPEPTKEKVLELISELEKFTKIHNKSNLNRFL